MSTVTDYANLRFPTTFEENVARFEFLRSLNTDDFTFEENDTFKSCFWEDGAGNEARLVLVPETQQVIIYGYDHESAMNFYDTDVEQKVFSGFPDNLKAIIDNSGFQWDWDEDTDTVYATVGYWFGNGTWNDSVEYEEQVNWDEEQHSANYVLSILEDTEEELTERFGK